MTGEELKQHVENALEEIRPFLRNDGGDIASCYLFSHIVRLYDICLGSNAG